MKKPGKQDGFTLIESLCVLLLALLVSFAILGGMQFTANLLPRSLSISRAQVLCSTLKTAVSGELLRAERVYVDGEGVLRGFASRGDAGEMQRFGAVDDTGAEAESGELTLGGERLLESSAYAGAKAALSIRYDGEENCFTVALTVCDGGGAEVKSITFDVLCVERPGVITVH